MKSTILSRVIVYLFFAIIINFISFSKALYSEVAAGEQECYTEYVKTKRTAELKIAVIEGEYSLDILLKAYGPFNDAPEKDLFEYQFFSQMVTSTPDSETGNISHEGFHFDTEHRGGWYMYCLDNTHSTDSPKTVDIKTYHGLTKEGELGEEDIDEGNTKRVHTLNVAQSLDRMATLLRKIKAQQKYYKKRSNRHLKTAMSNQSRIFWYTVLEFIVLGGLYGIQVYLLHQWFTQNRVHHGAKQWA